MQYPSRLTIYTETFTQYCKYKNTQMYTYTDQHRYKHIQVLNKEAAWTNKVQLNMQTNMQISHRHTRTVNEQNEHSKPHEILLWGNQLNSCIKKYQKFRNK